MIKKIHKTYFTIFLLLFITIPEIKIENPFLIESGKHKRSRNYKDKYRLAFGLKPRR